jgi:hypothetical protein
MWNIRRRSIAATYWFRPYGELLDSLRSPSGPAFGCYYASLRISSLAQKVTKHPYLSPQHALVFQSTNSQTTPNAPSGGRVESLRKGLSGMDAARAAMGQGWPFAACHWSNDGTREVERSETRMQGARLFAYFWGVCQK